MRNSIVVTASLSNGLTGWAFDLSGGDHPYKLWVAISFALGKVL